jgi:sortase A
VRARQRPWLRWTEKLLWIAGLLLLGNAVTALSSARIYQARQARAISAAEHGDQSAALDPAVIGLVEIPRIGVSAVVREGVDSRTLKVAVGHVPGTARPGQRGNVALAAHRDSFFRQLKNVRRRDRIYLHTPQKTYEYRVDFIEVVTPTTTRVLLSSDRDVLTLVTCYPFNYVGNAPKRFIVRATAVMPQGGPDIQEAKYVGPQQARPEQAVTRGSSGAGAVP